MRNINEYLLTKNNMGVYNGFPKKPDPDKIIQFLTNRGFEEIVNPDSMFYYETALQIYNAKKPVFNKGSYSPNNIWSQSIMFGDSSESSKELRIFYVRTSEKLIKDKPDFCFMYWDLTDEPDHKMGEYNATKCGSYEELVETINEYYEWQ